MLPDEQLTEQILDGFGPSRSGQDPLDAVVGRSGWSTPCTEPSNATCPTTPRPALSRDGCSASTRAARSFGRGHPLRRQRSGETRASRGMKALARSTARLRSGTCAQAASTVAVFSFTRKRQSGVSGARRPRRERRPRSSAVMLALRTRESASRAARALPHSWKPASCMRVLGLVGSSSSTELSNATSKTHRDSRRASSRLRSHHHQGRRTR